MSEPAPPTSEQTTEPSKAERGRIGLEMVAAMAEVLLRNQVTVDDGLCLLATLVSSYIDSGYQDHHQRIVKFMEFSELAAALSSIKVVTSIKPGTLQ